MIIADYLISCIITTYSTFWARPLLTQASINKIYAYVYLYSHFGSEYGANAGFEEWAVRMASETQGTVVPVPAAVLLGMLGLGVAGLKLRKFA